MTVFSFFFFSNLTLVDMYLRMGKRRGLCHTAEQRGECAVEGASAWRQSNTVLTLGCLQQPRRGTTTRVTITLSALPRRRRKNRRHCRSGKLGKNYSARRQGDRWQCTLYIIHFSSGVSVHASRPRPYLATLFLLSRTPTTADAAATVATSGPRHNSFSSPSLQVKAVRIITIVGDIRQRLTEGRHDTT